MKLISFRLSGRYGHFLRAEGGAGALSYPVPPRTVILGIMGAVLGLEKDQPQQVLEPAQIALRGRLPQTHWHKAKLRKDPPASLPRVIKIAKKAQKREKTPPEKAYLLWQEWLFGPDYTVWVSVPDPFFTELEQRIAQRKWHFQPCLGLSEMGADLTFLKTDEALPLPQGFYMVNSVFPQNDVEELDMDKIFEDKLAVRILRMPRAVTPDRVFAHAAYVMERDARPVTVKTDKAFKAGNEVLIFL